MNAKALAWAALAGIVSALAGCAVAPVPATGREGKEILAAKKFPEIELWREGAGGTRVKLIRLEGERVVFLPFPYWNVDSRVAAVSEIQSVRLLNGKKHIKNGILTGFGVWWSLAGALGLANSKYDVDYSNSLTSAPLVGLFVGVPLGLLAGAALSAATPPSRYDFSEMNAPRKYAALRRLMGI